MNTRVSKKYYLIPLFYIGLIAALLYFQFAREEPFHLSFGALEVSGHVIAGKTDPPQVSDISLRINGLTFSFGRTTPVRVALENGSSQTVAIRSYTTVKDGVQLAFSSGLTIRFLVGGAAHDSLTITPSMPTGVQVSDVSFPYSVARNEQTKSRSGIPVLAITRTSGGTSQTHVLALPFQSKINSGQNTIVLSATGGKFAPATYTPTNKPNLDPVVYWFEQNGDLPDTTSFDSAVKSYLDKAWTGWTSTRFDEKAGTWQMRDGSPSFKQSIVNAVIAESIARGSAATWLPAMRNAASLHANDITLETTPYFGNLAQTYSAYESNIAQTLLSYEQEIQKSGSGAFSIHGLLTYVTDHGNQSTAQALLAKMAQAKPAEMNLQELLGLLDDDLAAEALGFAGDYLNAGVKLIDQQLLPSIIRTSSGFFLETDTGTADIASSVFAGRLLIEAGTRAKNPTVEGIGRQLIVSALSLSDNEGFIPGRLSISGDTVSGTEGFLAPEKIYSWIAPDSYYPREIPLASQIGDGVWAWAASHITSATSTKNETSVTFDYPVGQIEHIVLHGIKPFNAIHLYGIAWRSDPQFEQYNAGWVYDAKSETLLIKLQHRRQQETVNIIY